MNLEIKMNKTELRKKLRNNLNHIIVLVAHPKMGYTCEFEEDKLIVNYKTVDGRLFTFDEFTLDDYGNKWDFEEPDVDDSLNDVDITAAELIEIAKSAEDEKRSKYKQAVAECVNDIKEDVARNIRSVAMDGKYSYTSKVNIKIHRYLNYQRLLWTEFEEDFKEDVYTKLKDFYNPKGFTVLLNSAQDEATVAVLSWHPSEKAKDKSIQPSLQSNEDLNKMLKATCDDSIAPFDLPRYNFHKADGLHPDLVCPYCGARHYEEGMTMQSLAYVPRIYKDGILQESPNPNWTITHYRCLECGKQFETKNDEIQKIENVVTAQGGEINV